MTRSQFHHVVCTTATQGEKTKYLYILPSTLIDRFRSQFSITAASSSRFLRLPTNLAQLNLENILIVSFKFELILGLKTRTFSMLLFFYQKKRTSLCLRRKNPYTARWLLELQWTDRKKNKFHFMMIIKSYSIRVDDDDA